MLKENEWRNERMKFKCDNIKMSGDDGFSFSGVLELTNGELHVSTGEEILQSLVPFDPTQFPTGDYQIDLDEAVPGVVDFETMEIGRAYPWHYIDDSLYELLEMNEEEGVNWSEMGTITRVE
jgi:hypothetical protein